MAADDLGAIVVDVYISYEMYTSDFIRIVVEQCAWRPSGKDGELDSFIPVYPERPHPGEMHRWTIAYAFGQNRLHVEAARGYLGVVGEPHQVVWYVGLRQFHGFLVLTNFQVPGLPPPELVMPGHRRQRPASLPMSGG